MWRASRVAVNAARRDRACSWLRGRKRIDAGFGVKNVALASLMTVALTSWLRGRLEAPGAIFLRQRVNDFFAGFFQ